MWWLLAGMLACQKRPRERGFDAEMSSPSMEPTCSPNRMLVFESPTSKRTRLMGQQSVAAGEERGGPSCSPFQSFASADAAGNTRPARPPPPRRPIPPSVSFPAPPAQSAAARGHGVAGRTRAHHSPCRASVATLLAHGASVAARATDRALTPSLPRRLAGNAAAEDAAMRHHREGSSSPRSGADGAMFSLEQVRDIVTRTVEARERVLRQEYDRVLQQKLQEQWASFAKFNEDYVSRTLKSSDLSYLS